MNCGGSIMNMSHTQRHLIALGALAVGLGGCYHSTQLANTWHDPTAGPVRFQKTVVAFATTDESLRRTVEDRLAERIPNAVQSYRIDPSVKSPDSTAILRRFADLGFDGAVIMRVADVDTRINYPYGTYWYGTPYRFGSYWGNSWGYAYDPYAYTDRIVAIETQIYDLGQDKLVWAGRSETTNPRSVVKLTDSVIKHVMKSLQKDNILVWLGCSARACATPAD
jgi:hypothetical protein